MGELSRASRKGTPMKSSSIPTRARAQRSTTECSGGGAGGIDQLIAELKTNRELFFRLSTDPQGTMATLANLNENEKALLSVVNPRDLVSIGFHGPGDIAACGGSCGASCGGSCGGSCGASCGGSCGGSCGASCGGSCVASCAGSCVASCVASGALVGQEDWYTNPADTQFTSTVQLAGIVRNEIAEFSAFLRQRR